MKCRSLLAASALFLSVLQLASCERSGDSAPQDVAVRVTIGQPQRVDVPVVEHVVGRIEQTGFATLAAEVAGRITEVEVETGDPVEQGQLLVRIDDRDYRAALIQAESRYEGLKAQWATQKRLLERLQHLLPQHFVTKNRLDEAQARLTQLGESLRAAKAVVTQARLNLDRTQVKAPFSGRIQARFVSVGDFIGVGKPLLSLSGTTGRHVRLPFPETLAASIHVGQRVVMHRSGSSEKFEASISELSPRISERSGTFVARVDLPTDKIDDLWRAGGSIEADVIIETHPNAVVVPEAALVLRPSGYVVYVVKDGIAYMRPVKPGVFLDGKVEILRGLKGDERIALDGAAYLSNGARIQQVGGA